MRIKKILTVLASTLLINSAWAETVTISVPFKPGGLSGRLAEAMKAAAEESKMSVEVEYLGNCKTAEEKFRDGKGEVYVFPTAFTVVGDCHFPVNEKNVVAVPYMQSLAMCYQKERAGLGAKHFSDPAIKKTIMANVAVEPTLNKWLQEMVLVDSTRVLKLGKSADVLRASFTNEADYFLVDAADAFEHKSRLDCVFVSNSTGSDQWPTLNKFSSRVSSPEVYTSQLLLITDVSKQQKYVSWFQNLAKQPAWQAVIARPGIEGGPDTKHWQFVQEQQKALSGK
jgi:hypothetical protein